MSCGGDLMVIARFLQVAAARHHDDGLAQFKSRKNGAHPGVRHYYPGRFNAFAELWRVDKPRCPNMPGTVVGRTYLRKNVRSATRCRPFVYGADQTVEWHLCADCHEDHRTDPA